MLTASCAAAVWSQGLRSEQRLVSRCCLPFGRNNVIFFITGRKALIIDLINFYDDRDFLDYLLKRRYQKLRRYILQQELKNTMSMRGHCLLYIHLPSREDHLVTISLLTIQQTSPIYFINQTTFSAKQAILQCTNSLISHALSLLNLSTDQHSYKQAIQEMHGTR